MKLRQSVILCCLLLRTASPALAGSVEESAALKARGDRAFDSRRFVEALEHYEEALTKHRDPRLHYNLGQAYSAVQRYPEALASYQSFIAEAPPGMLTEAQRDQLFALLEELKGQIARVTIECDVEGARILVRSKEVGRTPLSEAVVVNAGQAKVEVVAQGYKPYENTLNLPGGAVRTLPVKLEREDFTGVVVVTSNVAGAQVYVDKQLRGGTPATLRLQRGSHVVEVKSEGHEPYSDVATVQAGKRTELSAMLERSADYTLAYVGYGMGIVGVAGGTVTGLLANSEMDKVEEKCDTSAKECGPAGQSELRSAQSWALMSNVAFGVGAVGIGLGTYGLLTAKPDEPKGRDVDVAMAPGGIQLRGRF